MAMLSDNTGGRSEARVISQPEVLSKPIPHAAVSVPAPATDHSPGPLSPRGPGHASTWSRRYLGEELGGDVDQPAVLDCEDAVGQGQDSGPVRDDEGAPGF